MADQITDNRTQITTNDTNANNVNLAGTAQGNTEAEIFIEGLGSVGEIVTTTLNGQLYNLGGATDLSNNTFYIWINCGIVGLLDTQAAGGFRIRFAGATIGNYFEVYVAGSDRWPTSVAGGWTQFVVDIEKAHTAAAAGDPNTGTGGTQPATSAIQYVGYAAITATVMTKHVDNTWIDSIWRLPKGLPGIIIEGRNGGTTPWSWQDLPIELGAGAGSAKVGAGGSIVLNTPVQFFVDDSSIHRFTDTNSLVLWDDQEWAGDDLYGIIISGSSAGSAEFRLGVSSSTGDDRTGAQGSIIAASTGSVRWFVSGSFEEVDELNILGATFIHANEILVNNVSASIVSTQFIDCNLLSHSQDSSGFLRNSVIDANTVAGDAFLQTDGIGSIKFGSFEYSDGHAIRLLPEITTPVTYSFEGNTFTNYLADDTSGSALFNDAGGEVLINVVDGISPTVRDGFDSTTDIQNPIVLTLTGIVSGSEVRFLSSSQTPPVELAGTDESGPTFVFNYTYAAGFFVDIVIFHISYEYLRISNLELSSGDTSIPIQQGIDRVYLNP
jgi:hypothetical protein